MTDNGHIFSSADLEKLNDIKIEDVDVPEWNATVRVRGLSGWERDVVMEMSTEMNPDGEVKNFARMRAYVLAHSIIDGDGDPVFTEQSIKERSPAALDRIWPVAVRLSKLPTDESSGEVLAKN